MGGMEEITMDHELLEVKMFGGFELLYNGNPVVLERGKATKATQLLQYFLFHKNQKISRDELLRALYEWDDNINPVNNLKVNIYRLRKLLAELFSPEREYIAFQGGKYFWTNAIPVRLDVHLFEEAVQELNREQEDNDRTIELANIALSFYEGEFLPMLSTSSWVTVENVRFKKNYLDIVRRLCHIYDLQKRYTECIKLCNRAIDLYPYEEEFYLVQIHTLIEQKQYKEASKIYDQASLKFFEDLGISPSQEMEQLYKQMCEKTENYTVPLKQIKESLDENSEKRGAYYCNYLAFIDTYHVVSRVVERSGQSAFLMLCTLTDTHGDTLEGEKLHEASFFLCESIQKSIRKGDIFTRYNKSQYLLMLVGINMENCSIVLNRIEQVFRSNSHLRGVRLHYSVLPAELNLSHAAGRISTNNSNF